MGDANLKRGEKWKIAKAKAIFLVEQGRGKQSDVEWFDTQKDIVQDIEAYENSIKTEDKPKETKSKKEK